MRQTIKLGDPAYIFNILTPMTINATIAAWANQCKVNGSGGPSRITQEAMSIFWDTITAAGLALKLSGSNAVTNCFVPDDLICCQTPITKPSFSYSTWFWANNGFVSSDLSCNGLHSSGSTYLSVGIGVAGVWIASGYTYGMTAITNGGLQCASGTIRPSASLAVGLRPNYGSRAIWDYGQESVDQFQVVINNNNGYFSGNVLAQATQRFYWACTGTNGSAHVEIANRVGTNISTGSALTGSVGFTHGYRNNDDGTLYGGSSGYLSFLSYNRSLTEAQSLIVFNAVQKLRTAFGGGLA